MPDVTSPERRDGYQAAPRGKFIRCQLMKLGRDGRLVPCTHVIGEERLVDNETLLMTRDNNARGYGAWGRVYSPPYPEALCTQHPNVVTLPPLRG
jgi:hypothetical protein